VYAYQKHLLEQGKSTGTAGLVEKTLKSFFRANEMVFKMNGSKVKVITTQIPNIQRKEIAEIIEVCGNTRMITAIHFLKESGMRISDCVEVKVEDIKEALEGDAEYFTWSLRQVKTQRMCDPVLGSEAIRWLRKWEDEKKRMGIESEYVFCVTGNYSTIRAEGDKMVAGTLGQLFTHYKDKAGITSGVSIHSLRKFHKTSLEYAGVPTSWINRMQGRVGEGTGGVYTKPNSEQLVEMFKRGYSELRIEGGSSEGTREYLEHLDAENEAFASRIAELEEFEKEARLGLKTRDVIQLMGEKMDAMEAELKALKKSQ
jgi:site-specific recombinase XerD